MKDKPELLENDKIIVLLLYMNEMEFSEAPITSTYPEEEFLNKPSVGCSFFNTVYVAGIGLSQGAAVANLNIKRMKTRMMVIFQGVPLWEVPNIPILE